MSTLEVESQNEIEPLRTARSRFERDYITYVLDRHQGNVTEAAKALGMQRTNLYRKIRQLNVSPSLLATKGRR